ncbi:aminotransferase class I/II-fold pyridoxal phosphate-dependent enzyme [Membranicola marinus]|uniref:Aminotransferase n=1 Tax=Membranihabitans marinus TaxID=1227546 RepID=A0A953HU90_9BACT|nr:aminotransferase class I/II-fold pyridoxal phosphate-dependent enzyme [Membranihabitans marinus]MBY5958311.1 aminotransferase class I/II-fold pyridoxal phosphate-dependent enzyme [Membranihabitans marinus]
MKVRPSNRISEVKEYYFSRKLKEIARLKVSGKPIINLGIGSPDKPPAPSVRSVFNQEVQKEEGHGYQSYYGIPELRRAFSDWYQKRYSVSVDADTEILPLIGSKEGIMHISMSFLNPGDEALVPDPGYPTYQSATALAGGENRLYKLSADNGWMPDLEKLAQEDLSRVRLMWVNYPHMPTGAQPTTSFWEELVAFGDKHNILICHDNPYSFILNPEPRSIFSVPGARSCCLELNSLSKSHNMAGWRIGALVGGEEFLSEVIKFKSNMDSGMFRATQLAAAAALKLDDEWYEELNSMYRNRKEIAYQILEDLGCDFERNQAGLFAWGKVPSDYEDGYALSDELLYQSDVFITPGGIFGTQGDPYIRISICIENDQLDEARNRVKELIKTKNAVV